MGYILYHKCKKGITTLAKFEVEYFERQDGSIPVEEFLLSQDLKMRAKIYRLLSLLEEFGNTLREPYSKSLENGIFEIRAKQGTDISRVLYFFVVGQKIILTNGFVKKTRKTPVEEIALAKKYRKDYEDRREI